MSESAENYLQIITAVQTGKGIDALAEKFKNKLKPGKTNKSKLDAYSKVLKAEIEGKGETLPKRSFDAGATTMGEAIIHLIDKDRFVKPTPNNIVSSRSHSLVYIKLISANGGIPLHLIIGDFAGVENKYDCRDDGIATDFLYLKNGKQYAYIPRPTRVEPSQPINDFTVQNVKKYLALTGGKTKRRGHKRNNHSKKVHQKGGAPIDLETLNNWKQQAEVCERKGAFP